MRGMRGLDLAEGIRDTYEYHYRTSASTESNHCENTRQRCNRGIVSAAYSSVPGSINRLISSETFSSLSRLAA
jgi:hypothetical protein